MNANNDHAHLVTGLERLSSAPGLPAFALSTAVRQFQRAYVNVYAIDCSDEELNEVDQIVPPQLMQLGSELSRALCSPSKPPPIDAYCFGRNGKLENLPEPIRRVLARGIGRGAWLADIRSIVVVLNGRVPLRRLMIHELSHALLFLLTGGFQFPLAIQEGYARLMEYHIKGTPEEVDREKHLSDIGSGPNGFLNSSEFMSVRDLLFFDSLRYATEANAKMFCSMTRSSLWLVTYFARIKSRRVPTGSLVLAELWRRRLTEPNLVYRCLAEMHEMTIEELECGFNEYCTNGKF